MRAGGGRLWSKVQNVESLLSARKLLEEADIPQKCFELLSGQGHLATVIKARATILCGSWKHLGEGTGARAFRWWIRNLDHRVLYSIHAVAQLNSTVSKIAEAARLYDAKQSTRSWLTWLHEGPAAGLGRQHQMSRVAGGWIPSRAAVVKGTDEARNDDPEHSWQNDLEDPSEEYVVHQANSADAVEVPLDKQQTVDLEADEWGSIWQAVKKQHQPAWPKEMGIQPPPLALPALKDVCSTFPADVGLGWDKLHPRALLRCSDCVLLLLIQVFFDGRICWHMVSAGWCCAGGLDSQT